MEHTTASSIIMHLHPEITHGTQALTFKPVSSFAAFRRQLNFDVGRYERIIFYIGISGAYTSNQMAVRVRSVGSERRYN